MRRLRSADGTAVHRRAARYHLAKCRAGQAPLFAALRAEMTGKYTDLKAKQRAVEDAEDDATDAIAEVDSAEVAFENLLRDIDADLAKLDRADPALNAQKTVFPEGYGKEIEPEGDVQLTVLPALRTRLAAFQGKPGIATALQSFDKAEATFRAALAAKQKATAKVEALFTEEQAARRAVREQLESAHGRLRDLFKARPALAEAFFLHETAPRSPPEAQPEASPKAPADKPAAPKPAAQAAPPGA